MKIEGEQKMIHRREERKEKERRRCSEKNWTRVELMEKLKNGGEFSEDRRRIE